MRIVTRFEANLLRLLYFFLGQEPPERALPLLETRLDAPPCLSRTTVSLVQAALAKGCTQLLARRGGWRREAYLRGERPRMGRLWERTETSELGLRFSRQTLDFLIWITATHPGQNASWTPAQEALSSGDRLLLFFAYEKLRTAAKNAVAGSLPRRAPLSEHGLLWLAYPEDYGETPERCKPDFAPWTNGVGAGVMEALQHDLADRWVEIETHKGRITAYEEMQALGVAQERVLTAFLNAAEKAERWDLARFLLRAASVLLGANADSALWVGSLRHRGHRLADRAIVLGHALTLLRHLGRLQQWERRARGIGYFDEGYAAAQAWLADWEQFQGEQLFERAQRIMRQLDPLRRTQ